MEVTKSFNNPPRDGVDGARLHDERHIMPSLYAAVHCVPVAGSQKFRAFNQNNELALRPSV
jgi:hypothetical protein